MTSNSKPTFKKETNKNPFGSKTLGTSSEQAETSTMRNTNMSDDQNEASGLISDLAPKSPELEASSTDSEQEDTPDKFILFQQNTSNVLDSNESHVEPVEVSGTVIKYQPVKGSDTIMQSRVATKIDTLLFCITCMKEYENKSLEELRWEDYQADRKGIPRNYMGASDEIPFAGRVRHYFNFDHVSPEILRPLLTLPPTSYDICDECRSHRRNM